jgi:WD40 repeat protein
VSSLVGHTGGVFSASWSPDGKHLQTVSADTSVRIWDVATASIVEYILSVNLKYNVSVRDTWSD